MNVLKNLWLRRPGAVIALVNAGIALGVAFGLSLSPEQIGGVMAIVAALLGLFSDITSVSRQALDDLVAADWPPPPPAA